MGELPETKVCSTSLAGKRIEVFTVTPAAASDTVVFTVADNGIRTIYGAWAVIEAGMDADLASLQVSFSSLTVTIVQKNAAGSAATDWTGASIRLFVLCD